MTDIETIKRLKSLTDKGLGDCKRALVENDGDMFVAATKLLTEEEVLEMQQSLRVREMAGNSIADPVTEEEKRLVERLIGHFVGERTRPINVGFLVGLALLHRSNKEFQASLAEDPARTIDHFCDLLDPDGEFAGLEWIKTHETKRCTSSVLRMPKPQSEWESDYIVLQHSRKKWFGRSQPRVFAIYKRTNMKERGIATIEELGILAEEVVPISRWVHEDLEFQSEVLANIAFDNLKRPI